LTFAVGDHDAVDDDGAATETAAKAPSCSFLRTRSRSALERTAPDDSCSRLRRRTERSRDGHRRMTSLPVEADTPEQADLQAISDIDRDVVIYAILEDELAVGWLIMYAASRPTPSPGGGPCARDLRAPGAEWCQRRAAGARRCRDGVTAELGRCHMSIREVLSLTPGAVIDLDRAAGAPVDVLVNGTVIARGEVVVIDEEFGIRISEILGAA
jgi:flagellar motor switch protein FliN